jgi:hypothetical protein
MKITKSQLREIIREEIQKVKQPKMSTRLKELIESGWVLSEDEYGDKRIKNPQTGREIKIKTALSYDRSHPAYQAAERYMDKADATNTVSSMRGKVSSDTKTDKIMGKLFIHGYPNWGAVEKMSPKSKEKLYKLVDTRVKLVSQLDDRLHKKQSKLDDKYEWSNDYDIGDSAQYTGPGADGERTYELGGRQFSGPSHRKYEKFFYDSPEANRAEAVLGKRSNFSAAYKNAAWTLKNPKMGVMTPDEAQSIVDEFEKLNNDSSKIKNLTMGNFRSIAKFRDELANSLSDTKKQGDNRYDKNIRGTRFDNWID